MATMGLAKIRITTKISEAKMAEYFIEAVHFPSLLNNFPHHN
jgi:hypothetical protein